MPEHHPRFVALDVHKHSILVGALDAQHQVVLAPRQVPIDHFLTWA